MRGIVGYGAYLPYWRIERKVIAEALGTSGGSGTRAVASYDEDTTSIGVEAGRAAPRGRGGRAAPRGPFPPRRPPPPISTRPTPPRSTPRSTCRPRRSPSTSPAP